MPLRWRFIQFYYHLADPRPPYRIFSALQLRNYLMSQDQSVCIEKWENLSTETQIKMKTDLFVIIREESNLQIQRQIAAAITAIAAVINVKSLSTWPEFEINVGRLLMDQGQNLLMVGVTIMENFILSVPSYFMERLSDSNLLISRCLSHDSKEVKLSGLSFFSACLKSLNPKKYRLIYEHSSSIYNTVYVIYKDHNSEEGIDTFALMLKASSKYFKRSFQQLTNLFSCIYGQRQCKDGTRVKILKMLIKFIQNQSQSFIAQKLVLKTILDMAFSLMIQANIETTFQWENPFKGYQEIKDDISFKKTKCCMDFISKLTTAVGEEVLIPLLLSEYHLHLKKQDWSHQYAAIMAISQIGEHLGEASTLKIGEISAFLQDPRSKLRYAACHAIGQIFSDLHAKLQKKIGNNIFNRMISVLQKEHVPIVISHAAAALSNVVDEISLEDISSKNFDRAVTLLLKLCAHEISLVRENSISALSSIIQIAQQHYKPYLNNTVNAMLGYLDQLPLNFVVDKLIGEIIELLTIAANSISPETFQPFLSTVINHIIKAQRHLNAENPHKLYIIKGWHRLCLAYGKGLSRTLLKVLPSLLNLTEKVIKQQLENFTDCQSAISSQFQSFDLECVQTDSKEIFQMLAAFIDEMKQQFTPYADRTSELLFRLINEPCRSEVKETACKCLPLLTEAAQAQDPESAIDLAKKFTNRLFQAVERQNHPNNMAFQIEAMTDIMQKFDTSFLQDQQLYSFSQRLLSIFKKVEEKKGAIRLQIQNGTAEEDEIENSQLVQVNLTILCGQLFRIHKEKALPFAKQFIRSIIPETAKQPSIKMSLVHVYFICDAVDHLGYQLLPDDWNNFGDALMRHLHSRNCSLRQGACYGLGGYAARTPACILKEETVRKWLQGLEISMEAQKEEESFKAYRSCRDNAISAYGKVIHAHFGWLDLVPSFRKWVKLLPLEYDAKERGRQRQILIELTNCHFERIMKSTPTDERDQAIAKVIQTCDEIVSEEGQIKQDLLKMAQDLSQKLKAIERCEPV